MTALLSFGLLNAGTAAHAVPPPGCLTGECPTATATPSPSGIPTSQPSSTPTPPTGSALTLVQGRIDKNGTPEANAQVTAIAWPAASVLESAAVGAEIPTWNVGQATTAADGTFHIDVDPAKLAVTDPNWNTEAGQKVSIELVATDTSVQGDWNFTSVLGSRGTTTGQTVWSNAAAEQQGTSAPTDVTMDLGSTPTAVEAHAGVSQQVDAADNPLSPDAANQSTAIAVADRSTLTGDMAAVFSPDNTDSPKRPVCRTIAQDWDYNRPEHFMNVYAWSGAPATVIQDYGVDHTLGIKFKSIGSSSWNGGGTATLSLKSSATRPNIVDAQAFNSINYRNFYNGCFGRYMRPVSVYGLLTDWNHWAPHVRYRTCTYVSDGSVTKTQGTNYTYSLGVDTPVGSVSAQSGYNSSSAIRWDFKEKSWLCGSNAEGWGSSPQAEAHSA